MQDSAPADDQRAQEWMYDAQLLIAKDFVIAVTEGDHVVVRIRMLDELSRRE